MTSIDKTVSQKCLNPLKAGQEFGVKTAVNDYIPDRVSIPLKRVKNSETGAKGTHVRCSTSLNPLKAGQEFGGGRDRFFCRSSRKSQSP